MIIDSHTHIFSPEVIEARGRLCSSDRCFGLLYSSPGARLCTAEDLIRSMDEQGIDLSIVQNIGWSSHEMCLRSNDYILESIARYPGRLSGFCAVQPLEGARALEELERCSRGGMAGVGELRPDVQGFDLSDQILMQPLVSCMAGLGMVLSLHVSEPVGHDYPGKGSNMPGDIYKFMAASKELKVILAHMGGGLPFYELMPEVREVLSNAWYDTAALPFLYSPAVYGAVDALGCIDRVIFGSDWPLVGPRRVMDHITEAGLGRAEVDALLGGNAQRLFNLEGK